MVFGYLLVYTREKGGNRAIVHLHEVRDNPHKVRLMRYHQNLDRGKRFKFVTQRPEINKKFFSVIRHPVNSCLGR